MNCPDCGSPVTDGICFTATKYGYCLGTTPTEEEMEIIKEQQAEKRKAAARKQFIEDEIEATKDIDFGHNPRKPVRENLKDFDNNKSHEAQEEFHPVVLYYVTQTDLNDTEISKITGIDRRTIGKLKTQAMKPAQKDHFGRVQKGPENDRVNAEIMRLNAEGLTYLQIAEQVGLSWQSVRSRLSKQFSKAMEQKRDDIAGRQWADMEVLRNEMLEIALSTSGEDFDMNDAMEMLGDGRVEDLLEMVKKKAKSGLDSRFKAVELILKISEREAKLFDIDKNSVTVNHNIRVDPEAVELMQRLKKREISDTIEGQVVDDEEMGSL